MMGDLIDTLRADVVMWKECAEERARHYSEALAVIDNTAKTVQAFRQEADKAKEDLADILDAMKSAEDPHPDERHCACVPLLRASLKAARAEAEKARMDWHAAENELWLGELREQIEKLREQRDRALKIAEDLSATGAPDCWSYRWDSAVVELNGLLGEIKKEKETE
jgi:chromosome segregation ATPase